jgi:hypothetical protein
MNGGDKTARLSMTIGLMSMLACGRALAQEPSRTPTIEIETKGAVTDVTSGADGWSGIIKKVQALHQIPRDQDALVIAALTKNMDNLPPPYAYELARRLCISDPQRASDVFALAGQRMRYDALRCTDETAKSGVQLTLISLQMPECKAMLSNVDLHLASLRKLRDAKEAFASKASPWWICSHGMKAFGAAANKRTLAPSDWLKPESEWPAIRKQLKENIDYTIEKHSKK